MSSNPRSLYRLICAALFLSLTQVLPFFVGQLPPLGNALCPMHLPVLLCGYVCGPWYALAVGAIAPLLRLVLFGAPPLVPTGIAMCGELAAYGVSAALLDRCLPKKRPFLYVSLIGAMLCGRLVWGGARAVLYGLGRSPFGWAAFVSGAFVTAAPGIAIQLVLIPPLVMFLKTRTPPDGRSDNGDDPPHATEI